MFTAKEIKETNDKTDAKLRQIVAEELRKRTKPDATFNIDQVADIFVVMAVKIVFVPDNYRLGFKQN